MNKKIFWIIIFLLIVFSTFLLYEIISRDNSYDNTFFTKEEIKFIANHEKITVSLVKDSYPYSFYENNQIKGFTIDLLQNISKEYGLNFEYKINDWYKNIEEFKNKRNDIISGISYRKEREEFTLFTKPYVEIPVVYISRKNQKEINNLKNTKIGIIRDIYYKKILFQKGYTDLIEYNTYDDLIKSVSYEKIDFAIVTLNEANYYIKKNGLINLKIYRESNIEGINKEDRRFGIAKENFVLSSIMNKIMNNISNSDMQKIKTKWFGLENIENKINLTKNEKEFIKNNPILRVSNEMDWPPFDFMRNNLPTGYSIDLIDLLAKKIGIEIEYVNGHSWSELVEMFKKGEIDMLHSLYKNKEREKIGYFTDSYFNNLNYFVVRDDFKDIDTFEDIKNLKIAKAKGYAISNYLTKNYPNIEVIDVKNSIQALEYVNFGKADIAIESKAVSNYIIDQYNFKNLKISGWASQYDQNKNNGLYFLFQKDLNQYVEIFNKVLRNIEYDEIQNLEEKWFNYKIDSIDFLENNLTKSELDYLSRNKKIKICIAPNWHPFEFFNEKKEFTGLVADYLKLIEKLIGVEFVVIPTKDWPESLKYFKQGKCDMLPEIVLTESRKEFVAFTKSYMSFPHVVLTKDDAVYVDDLNNFDGKTFACMKDYGIVEILKSKYSNINIIEVETMEEGVNKVIQDKIYGLIDSLPSISYYIQKEGVFNLKINGEIDYPMDLYFGIQKDNQYLVSILNLAINSISEEEIKFIKQKWVKITYQHQFDYRLFFKILIIILIIIVLIIYWNRKLYLEIVQRKRIEKSLNETNLKLEKAIAEKDRANKSKSEFIANMSHEFRTPLNAVIGFSDLLNSIVENEDYKKYIKSIKTAGQSLLTLVNDILDLSKLESKMLSLNIVETDIKEVSNDINMMFENILKDKGVEFFIEFIKDFPEIIYIDKIRLRQILINIVGNAQKFTHSGYIKLEFDYSKEEFEDKINVFIKVVDTGIGISKENLDKIFETFQQVDSADNRNYKGTGLGLSICKKLITIMNGSINVESELGEGTSFEISLPNIQYKEKEGKREKFIENGEKLIISGVDLNIKNDLKRSLKIFKKGEKIFIDSIYEDILNEMNRIYRDYDIEYFNDKYRSLEIYKNSYDSKNSKLLVSNLINDIERYLEKLEKNHE